MLPKRVESLWVGTTPVTNFPVLKKGIKVDAAIVGAGITGLNTAYFLKRKGLKVAVVEATYIASDTSGNTTAKVTSQHELKYAFLKKSLGKQKAQIYADSNQWAISILRKIIKDEKIDCDFHVLPAYTYSRTKKGAEEIKKEVEAAKELNLPAEFVSSVDSIPFKIEGAIRFDNQAYFHPRKYLLSIADKINTNGSYIFEKTEVLDIEEGKKTCKIITERGNLKAKYAVVATNFPFYDKNKFFADMREVRSYVLAVRLNTDLPQGMFIGTGKQDLSFRPHVSGKNKWMTVGGIHHLADEDESADFQYQKLEKLASKQFDIKTIDYRWAAQDSYSKDRIPYIGRMPRSKNVFVATGFGAWGMTTSFVSAKILTDLIMEVKNEWENLYSPEGR